MNYTTIPHNIQAVQWTGKNLNEVKAFAEQVNSKRVSLGADNKFIILHSIDGNTGIFQGDYLIKDAGGDLQAVKKSTFERTYKPSA